MLNTNFDENELSRLSTLFGIFKIVPKSKVSYDDGMFCLSLHYPNHKDKSAHICFFISKTYEPVTMVTSFVVHSVDWLFGEVEVFNSYPNIEQACFTLEKEARNFCLRCDEVA